MPAMSRKNVFALYRFAQRLHRLAKQVAALAGHAVGAETGQRHPDEVDQVVGGEGHGQREGAGQDDHLENVDPGEG